MDENNAASANIVESDEKKKSDADIQKNYSFNFSDSPSLEDIRRIQSEFVQERNWNQYHTPRNLLLALMGEVGELAEIFQWRGEVPVGVPGFSDIEKKHLGQEMADVLLYLIRMAERSGIDLPQVTMDKIELNKQKYPVDKSLNTPKLHLKEDLTVAEKNE